MKIKKVMSCFASLVIAANIFAVSAGAAVPSPAEGSDLAVFGETLDDYCFNIRTDWEHYQPEDIFYGVDILNNKPKSYLWYATEHKKISQTGFCFIDIDGDGVNELIVGGIDENIGQEEIYDIYSFRNGGKFRLAAGGGRVHYSITEDGKIREVGADGASFTTITYYEIGEDVLVPACAYKHEWQDGKVKYSYSEKAEISENFSYKFSDWNEITAEEFDSKTAPDDLKLNYTLFSEYAAYKDGKNLLIGDISGNETIDLYDAITVAKVILGKIVLTEAQIKLADHNGNGKVDLYDAIGIAKEMIKKG